MLAKAAEERNSQAQKGYHHPYFIDPQKEVSDRVKKTDSKGLHTHAVRRGSGIPRTPQRREQLLCILGGRAQ